MFASMPSRRLLDELRRAALRQTRLGRLHPARPHVSALAFSPFATTAARLPSQRNPGPPISPQEQIIRDALARLTPEQITALLSNPNPAGIPPPHPPPPPPPPKQGFLRRRRRLLAGFAVAFASFLFFRRGTRAIRDADLEPGSRDWFERRGDAVAAAVELYAAARAGSPRLGHIIEMGDPAAETEEELAGFRMPYAREYARWELAEALAAAAAAAEARGGNKSGSGGGPDEDADREAEDMEVDRRHMLAGAAKYAIPVWLYFQHEVTKEIYLVVVFGPTAAGFPGIVHGGLQASVMLEMMRAAAMMWGMGRPDDGPDLSTKIQDIISDSASGGSSGGSMGSSMGSSVGSSIGDSMGSMGSMGNGSSNSGGGSSISRSGGGGSNASDLTKDLELAQNTRMEIKYRSPVRVGTPYVIRLMPQEFSRVEEGPAGEGSGAAPPQRRPVARATVEAVGASGGGFVMTQADLYWYEPQGAATQPQKQER